MRRLGTWTFILVSGSLLLASGAHAARLIAGYNGPLAPSGTALYEVDASTAIAQRIVDLPQRGWTDLAARSDDEGHVYAVSRILGPGFENRVSRIDLASGLVTDLYTFFAADFGLSQSITLTGIAISGSDPSIATIAVNVAFPLETFLFDLDLDTGARSAARTVSGLMATQRLTIAPDGTPYTIISAQPRRLGVIDPATATSTEIGTCACSSRSMDFDPSGQLFAIDTTGRLQELSPTTAATLRDIGPTGLGISSPQPAAAWGMAFVVPEPHTGVLLALGLGTLAQRRRDRSSLAS